MGIRYQFNKTSMQQLKKELAIRENALPTLKAKEAALRVQVKKAKEEVERIEREIEQKREEAAPYKKMWAEFPEDIIKLRNIDLEQTKIAGIQIPSVNSVDFTIERHSIFATPFWIPEGIGYIKELFTLRVRKGAAEKAVEILEYARKKTTQKVNLYEKVQIPEYNKALLKIKRYLEDQENLAKSSQKILKARLQTAEV
ncbi:MAG: V-type ATP synthase subunit D [Chitinivibrionales bacterium]